MICKKCGQGEPVVAFRPHPTAKRHICRACERDDQRIREYQKRSAMDAIRENAPRMEYVTRGPSRRAEDSKAAEETEKLKAELEALKQIHPLAPSIIEPVPDHGGDAIAGVIASDWHVEEEVNGAKVHGINEYNLDIARQRAHRFFQNTLRLTNIYANSSNITTIFMAFLGDFISNYLHEVHHEINKLGPSHAINFALSLLRDGILFLLNNSSYNLIIDCVHGNHGRMTLKPRTTNSAETSLETFMYQVLAKEFDGHPRVQIRVAEGKMLYRKFFDDCVVRLCHGDDIMYGGGVGGITIPIRKKIAAWDKAVPAKLTLMGHFHQLINGGDFLVNGSLIGYNEYAQAIGASPEEARQCFFLLHSRKGGQLSTFTPIWLD